MTEAVVGASPRVGDAVFDLVPIAMVLCDVEGRLHAVNRAMASLLQGEVATLGGADLTAIFADDEERLAEVCGQWKRSATPRPAGLHLRGRDGGLVAAQVAGARVPGTDDVLLQVKLRSEAARHFAYLSRDVEVRDLRELRARLEDTLHELGRSNRRLSATNEELEHYASIISHDLRGPISAIRQFAELLRVDAAGDDDATESLDAIVRLSEKASAVADSLLRLARAGSFEDVRDPVDIGHALALALDQLQAQEDPAVTIRAGGLPSVMVHEAHLVQILANLVGNSMRYRHPERPLEVEVSAHVAEGWATVVVADNGVGVASGDHERIFLPNVRGTTVVDEEGTGLGLALCRRLVAGYGGRIELDPERSVGAAFTFTLPGGPDSATD